MSALNRRIVRISCTVPGVFPAALIAVGTNRTAESVRSNATRFEFGFFNAAGVACDLANVESLNLKLQPSQDDETGVLADQTITVLDLTTTAETWADGTKQHAVFELSNAEMNLAVESSPRSLWLVVTAIMDDGYEYTLTGGIFNLHEDNNAAGDPPPENPGTALTLEQGDARYLPLALSELPEQGVPAVPRPYGCQRCSASPLQSVW